MSDFQQKRPRGRPPKTAVERPRLFQFASVDMIQERCKVSRSMAYKYKNGTAKPSPAAECLFQLYESGKVLTDEWAEFIIKGRYLFCPDNKSLTPGQLRAYAFVLQLANEHAKSDPQLWIAMNQLTEAFARETRKPTKA